MKYILRNFGGRFKRFVARAVYAHSIKVWKTYYCKFEYKQFNCKYANWHWFHGFCNICIYNGKLIDVICYLDINVIYKKYGIRYNLKQCILYEILSNPMFSYFHNLSYCFVGLFRNCKRIFSAPEKNILTLLWNSNTPSDIERRLIHDHCERKIWKDVSTRILKNSSKETLLEIISFDVFDISFWRAHSFRPLWSRAPCVSWNDC